jgi:hypothetical protein
MKNFTFWDWVIIAGPALGVLVASAGDGLSFALGMAVAYGLIVLGSMQGFKK